MGSVSFITHVAWFFIATYYLSLRAAVMGLYNEMTYTVPVEQSTNQQKQTY